MFSSDMEVYVRLRSVVSRENAMRIFLRFGVNCFGRHWSRIASETDVPRAVAQRVFSEGNNVFREILRQDRVTTHDLGALGLIHDDWFSMNREVEATMLLEDVSCKESLKEIVNITARPLGVPAIGKGPSLRLVMKRAERLWEAGLLSDIEVTCSPATF